MVNLLLSCYLRLISVLATEWGPVILVFLGLSLVSLIMGSIMFIGGILSMSTVLRIRIRLCLMGQGLARILQRWSATIPIPVIRHKLLLLFLQMQISLWMRGIILSGLI